MTAKLTPINEAMTEHNPVQEASAPPVERLTADELTDVKETAGAVALRTEAVQAAMQALHEATGAAHFVRTKLCRVYGLTDADRVEDDGTITRAVRE